MRPQAGSYHLLIPPAAGKVDANSLSASFRPPDGHALVSVTLSATRRRDSALMTGGRFPPPRVVAFSPASTKQGHDLGCGDFRSPARRHDLNGRAEWYRQCQSSAHVPPGWVFTGPSVSSARSGCSPRRARGVSRPSIGEELRSMLLPMAPAGPASTSRPCLSSNTLSVNSPVRFRGNGEGRVMPEWRPDRSFVQRRPDAYVLRPDSSPPK